MLFISSCDSLAQVKDKAFNTMLNTLLDHSVPELSVDSFYINKAHYLILDAREKKEFDVSHIHDAKWIGYDSFNAQTLVNIDHSKPLLVYCSVGYRSEKIAEKLMSLGFNDVHNLYGGIFEWANLGLSLYQSDTLTNKIHAYDKKWGFWLNDNYKKVY